MKRLLKAIDNDTFCYKEGQRKWHNLILNITKLIWERNLVDGWRIEVYDLRMTHQATINIDGNLNHIAVEEI